MTVGPTAPAVLTGRESRAMGSPLRLLVSGLVPEAVVDVAWTAVRDEFEAVERAMSSFRETSEITLLCRAAPTTARAVTPRLRRALVACDRAMRLTEGRFDPRVVADLERLGFGAAARRAEGDASSRGGAPSPRPGRLFDCRPTGAIALEEPVDLGGIGKGLALRWAADAVARVLGLDPSSGADGSVEPSRPGAGFLLDAGGDIVVRGASAPGEPWWVAIEDPAGGIRPLAVVGMEGNAAIATSSTRIHRRETDQGVLVHHLIDPRTHEPAIAGLSAVTVAGPDPAWAEVWSKALFVEGRTGIATLARSRGLAAWWVGEDGSLEMTAAARARTAWVDAEVSVARLKD